MKGKLVIKAKGSNVRVKGYLMDSGPLEHLAVVDALMNTFGITGELREQACKILCDVDLVRKNKEEQNES